MVRECLCLASHFVSKYIYLCKELVTLYNKVSFVNNVLINMNEQCIYYIYVLIFVNVG